MRCLFCGIKLTKRHNPFGGPLHDPEDGYILICTSCCGVQVLCNNCTDVRPLNNKEIMREILGGIEQKVLTVMKFKKDVLGVH